MADMRDVVGKNLRELRKARGWSQETLAELSDSTYVNISAIENARRWPSPEMVEKLATALGVPRSRLFFEAAELSLDMALATIAEALGYVPPIKKI